MSLTRSTPSFIASAESSYFSFTDLKNGQRKGNERKLQCMLPGEGFTLVSLSFFRLFPGIASGSRNFASRLSQTLPRTGFNLLFAGWRRGRKRFVFHKIVAVWIDHINDSQLNRLLRFS